MFSFFKDPSKLRVPAPAEALPGRDAPSFEVPPSHAVLGTPLQGPWPEGHQVLVVGMGCFWGAERLFWKLKGVHSTQVGYAGGHTRFPTYREVCSGKTGHTEVVRIVFNPREITLEALLQPFWEEHDPTQGMRQGNDVGTQYRSALYASTAEQLDSLLASRDRYQAALTSAGKGSITTEIALAGEVYLAEPYHQQYLHKNPAGYCGLKGTGVACVPAS
ncbi:MAG: peptide-methionine (S)-S-oxide reductase MsrA [Deltaproteobacteria bacterium]|nr:MAG: peptide-methionine (S)-S-oxide reductase MsrA [Deltaproteobacteria bacterium]